MVELSADPRDCEIGWESLRQLELFAELSDQDLQDLLGAARGRSYEAGETIIVEGQPGDAMYVVIDGEVEVTKRAYGEDVLLAVRGVGEFVGEMALLEGVARTGTARARGACRLLEIKEADFYSLLARSPSATRAIVRAQSSRLRSTLQQLQAQEKLALLGQLAAGLIHDLNNPSASIQRGAGQLRDALGQMEQAAADMAAPGLAESMRDTLATLREEARSRARAWAMAPRNPLAEADREDAVRDWLDEHGVEQAWSLAPDLASEGWDAEMLDRLATHLPGAYLAAALRWLGARSSSEQLVGEIAMAARAISAVVRAVKDYSYLDQAPVQDVDVHRGIEDALVLLKHKVKSGIVIAREFAPDLPKIEAYGSQLNQVWLNILDNALDALGDSGEIRIRTDRDGDSVQVDLCDNGPGIPAEIQPRIFDAFFTTKPPGVGSGQGLHTAYSIVVLRHRGQLHVESQPGSTCFRVRLPLQLARA